MYGENVVACWRHHNQSSIKHPMHNTKYIYQMCFHECRHSSQTNLISLGWINMFSLAQWLRYLMITICIPLYNLTVIPELSLKFPKESPGISSENIRATRAMPKKSHENLLCWPPSSCNPLARHRGGTELPGRVEDPGRLVRRARHGGNKNIPTGWKNTCNCSLSLFFFGLLWFAAHKYGEYSKLSPARIIF